MRIFFLAASFIWLSVCHAGSVEEFKTIDEIEIELEKYLYTKYKEFQVTEIFSRNDDKKSFFRSALGDQIVDGSIGVESKELYFKELTAHNQVHIGIASVAYADESTTKKAYEELKKEGYFNNTKILTKYAAIKSGKEIFIIYSESAIDKNVSLFINQLSSQSGR